MNRRSISFRLVSWYCGLLLILGVASGLYTYTNFDRYLQESTRATLASRAVAIWDFSRDLIDNGPALATLMEQRFAPEAQNRFISIAIDGRPIYRSGPPVEHAFDPSRLSDDIAVRSGQVINFGDVFVYYQRFTLPDGRTAIVQSGNAAEAIVAAEHKLATSLLIGIPLLLICAAAGGYWLVNRALAPVKAMIGAAEALTFNSPQNRLPPAGTGDDIDALGRTLNRMLDRLDHAYQHASKFSADSAHELRTPLSIMQGELELLASARGLPEDVQDALGNILDETMRLSHIVGSLTALSRLDSIAGKRAHRAVDLLMLATETIDQMRLLAVEKDIIIDPPSGPHAMAAGDRDRLKQVVVNLLDNAIKYTPHGGRIWADIEETGGQAILTVRDTGIGIAAENLPHVFDRFYRVAADRGEVGAGLGLAIVKSICTAHGGTVTAESAIRVGSRFRVSLPQASAALAAAAPGQQSAGSRLRHFDDRPEINPDAKLNEAGP